MGTPQTPAEGATPPLHSPFFPYPQLFNRPGRHWQRLGVGRVGRYELCMFGVVVVATLARVVLLAFHWPITNSDEGNMGLLAMHVAYHGELPIFFYGLPYMGPVEGYLAAPLFRLFGVSLFALRLPLALLFTLFLVCMYYLTRLLYTEKFALAIVVLLSCGSGIVLLLQLRASGEYPEMELCAALISLLASWLALSSHTFSPDAEKWVKRKRILVYGFLGCVVGLALWVDFLILPFVLTAGLLLMLFCQRELRTWAGVSLLTGILIGMFPLLVYNVSAPPAQDSLHVLYRIHQAGASQMAAQHIPFLRQVVGTVMVSLPLATEIYPYCPLKAFPLFGPAGVGAAIQPCVMFQGGWGIGFVLLGILAAYSGVRCVGNYWRRYGGWGWSFEGREEGIRQCARLMLLASAAITLVSYMLSPISAVVPDVVWRYLICVLVALPAVLWPLWSGNSGLRFIYRLPPAAGKEERGNAGGTPAPPAEGRRPLHTRLGSPAAAKEEGGESRVLLILKVGVLLLIAVTFFLGTLNTFLEGVPEAQGAYAQEDALVQDLLRIGATRIYSEYWTCNRLIFHSQERIICSALNEQLKPGFDRYPPYRVMVRANEHPTYVFPLHSPQTMTFQQEMLASPVRYRHYVFEGYDVYQFSQLTQH